MPGSNMIPLPIHLDEMNIEIIKLPRFVDPRGALSVVENNINIPFEIKRVYFTYDVPAGESRAHHAHKALRQLIIAISGSFTVELDDGHEKRSILLNKPYEGLLVNPGIWRNLVDFSTGAVALVLCSEFYDPDDYIFDYSEFMDYVNDSRRIAENIKFTEND